MDSRKRLLAALICVMLCACAGAKVRTKGTPQVADPQEDPYVAATGGG